jgi:glucose/arabinose dehydrogenase
VYSMQPRSPQQCHPQLSSTRSSIAALAVLLGVACSESPTPPRLEPAAPARSLAPGEIADPIPGHIVNGAIQGQLETVSTGSGLTAPNWGTFAPGQPNTLFVVDQDGPLWAVDLASGRKTVFHNTRALLVPLGAFGPGTFDERGFLGAAFHPGYATNGLFYTYTSEPCAGCNPSGQPNHQSVVREWRATNRVPSPATAPNNDDRVRGAASAVLTRVLLVVRQPQFNHNGGALFFGRGPTGATNLYVTLGDGGCADDQLNQLGLQGEGPCIGHNASIGNAQDPSTPLGKLLRIDVSSASPTPQQYARGFRNPFRGSADRLTGEIWVADVGQNDLEEVDARVVQGGNYGWRVKEGRPCFNPSGFELFGFASDGFPTTRCLASTVGLIDPVAQYDHDEGVATIGGFVYRGSRFPALYGRYVFGDHSRRPNNGNGEVFYVDERDASDPNVRTPRVFHLTNGPINLFVLGFGEDAGGELYVLANKTGIPFGEEGYVMRVVPRCAAGRECRD